MLNRLKNLWKLSKYSGDAYVINTDSITPAMLKDARAGLPIQIPVRTIAQLDEEPNGEFMPDMTEDEVLQYERQERDGWKKFKLPFMK